jgi:hypothetical protein
VGDLIRFVSAIDATPTLRLDLNDEASWWVRKFDAPPPRLRRSMASNAMRDGIHVGSTSYDARTLVIELECLKSTQDEAATQLQLLARELDRANNWLMYQPNGLTKPVFFRTFRSDASQIADVVAQAAMREFTVEVLAEPFALGLKETLGPYTINNDPAAGSNPCYVDLPTILGDVAAPLVLWDGAAGDAGRYIVSTHAASAVPLSWEQAESMTLGTDTTNPGGGPDAAMSGTGTNNSVRTSFATDATMRTRLTWAVPATAIGRFRVVALLRGTSTSGTYSIAASANPGSAGLWVTGQGNQVAFAGSIGSPRRLLDLGLVSFPSSPYTGYADAANTLATTSLYIFASRLTGANSIDWDAIILLPVGGQAGEFAPPATLLATGVPSNPVIDGVAETVVARTVAGDPTTGAATFNRGVSQASVVGAFPQVCPAAANRIFLLRVTSTGDSAVTSTTAVSGAYWPRYLYVRPATT